MTRSNGRQIDYDALVKPDAVHGDCYIDPDIFAEEQKRIFGRGWVYIGHKKFLDRAIISAAGWVCSRSF